MSSITPETRVKNKIMKFIEPFDQRHSGDLYQHRRDAIGANYEKGLPDLWILINGTHIEVEIKKPGGKRTPEQERWERRLKAVGAVYWLIDDAEEFKSLLTPYLPK